MFKLLYQEKLEKINLPVRINKTQTLPVKFLFYLNLYFFSVFVCVNITNQYEMYSPIHFINDANDGLYERDDHAPPIIFIS